MENKPIGAITLFQQKNKQYKEIIDGKQRIYALEDFWKGRISYHGDFLEGYFMF